MRTPQLLVYERDRKAAPLLALVRETALIRGWWLRDLQDEAACLRILEEADQAVFVLEVGRNLSQEFTLLDRIQERGICAAIVVVGAAENVALSNLAWELGASYVLFPPLPLELLPDIIAGLMQPATAPALGGRT